MKNLAIWVVNKKIVAYALKSFRLSKDLNGQQKNLGRSCFEYKRLTAAKMRNLTFKNGYFFS